MNTTLVRVALFILLFVSTITMPWWISVAVLIGATVYFPVYLEILFFAFLFDTLYSTHYIFPFTSLTLATVFLALTIVVKTQVRK